MRGITSSLYIIVTTLFGIGIGPFVVGMISDANGGNLAAAILAINWVAPAIVVMLVALALRVRGDEEQLIARARRGGEGLPGARATPTPRGSRRRGLPRPAPAQAANPVIRATPPLAGRPKRHP